MNAMFLRDLSAYDALYHVGKSTCALHVLFCRTHQTCWPYADVSSWEVLTTVTLHKFTVIILLFLCESMLMRFADFSRVLTNADGDEFEGQVVLNNRKTDETSSYTIVQKFKCLWGLRLVSSS